MNQEQEEVKLHITSILIRHIGLLAIAILFLRQIISIFLNAYLILILCIIISLLLAFSAFSEVRTDLYYLIRQHEKKTNETIFPRPTIQEFIENTPNEPVVQKEVKNTHIEELPWYESEYETKRNHYEELLNRPSLSEEEKNRYTHLLQQEKIKYYKIKSRELKFAEESEFFKNFTQLNKIFDSWMWHGNDSNILMRTILKLKKEWGLEFTQDHYIKELKKVVENDLRIPFDSINGKMLSNPNDNSELGAALSSAILFTLAKMKGVHFHIYRNVLVPHHNNNFTEIDHVIVSTIGIFAVEVKSRVGVFSGNIGDETLTLKTNKDTSEVLNPLFQNLSHINYLSEYLANYPTLDLTSLNKRHTYIFDAFINVVNFFGDEVLELSDFRMPRFSFSLLKSTGKENKLQLKPQLINQFNNKILTQKEVKEISKVIAEISITDKTLYQEKMQQRDILIELGEFQQSESFAIANIDQIGMNVIKLVGRKNPIAFMFVKDDLTFRSFAPHKYHILGDGRGKQYVFKDLKTANHKLNSLLEKGENNG